MRFLKSKKAAAFCFISGISLITIGVFFTQDSSTSNISMNTRQAWYYITGIALSVSGVVQFMRDERI
jgi:hypothetical protein